MPYRDGPDAPTETSQARSELERLAARGRGRVNEKDAHDKSVLEGRARYEEQERKSREREERDRLVSAVSPWIDFSDFVGKSGAFLVMFATLMFFTSDEDTGKRMYSLNAAWIGIFLFVTLLACAWPFAIAHRNRVVPRVLAWQSELGFRVDGLVASLVRYYSSDDDFGKITLQIELTESIDARDLSLVREAMLAIDALSTVTQPNPQRLTIESKKLAASHHAWHWLRTTLDGPVASVAKITGIARVAVASAST